MEDIKNTNPELNHDGAASKEEPVKKDNQEQMIPKHRFDEINEKYKEMKAVLDKIETDKSAAEKKVDISATSGHRFRMHPDSIPAISGR